MSSQDHEGDLHKLPPSGIIIPSDEERIAAEEAAEQERRRGAEDAYKERQVAIAGRQTTANENIARYTLILVIGGALSNLITFGALWVSKRSSDAATAAAKVAQDTLVQTQSSGASTAVQLNQLIGNINWQAREMMNSVGLARSSAEINERNAKAALDASIRNSQLDQRAWVSAPEMIILNRMRAGESLRIAVEMKNTGRTPAIQTKVVWDVKFRAKPAPPIQTHFDGKFEIAIGPGAIYTQIFRWPHIFSVEDIERLDSGKDEFTLSGTITYRDIFTDTPLRETGFCGTYSEKDKPRMASCDTGIIMK